MAWLRAFGPATEADLAWWFGQTLTWARAALIDVGAVPVGLSGDAAVGHLAPDDLEPEPDVGHWCALLPELDVTTMGWQQRGWYVGNHRARIFDRNGNGGATAWVDGRIVGGWQQDDDARVRLRLLEDVGPAATRALHRRAAELTDWLAGVRVAPRFPSPLTRG